MNSNRVLLGPTIIRRRAGSLNSGTSDYIKNLMNAAKLDPESEAGRASIDVGAQYDKSLGIQARNMGRMGINPASPRYQGLMQDVNMARAASSAGEMGRARRAAENENYSRLSGIASLMQNERQIAQGDSRLALARQEMANSEKWRQEEMRGDKEQLAGYQSGLEKLLGLTGSNDAEQRGSGIVSGTTSNQRVSGLNRLGSFWTPPRESWTTIGGSSGKILTQKPKPVKEWGAGLKIA